MTRGTDTFAYVYDLAGNLTRRTYADGTVVAYAFDDESRMTTVTTSGSTTTYAYDAAANLETTYFPTANGQVETRSYDRAGRLNEIQTQKTGTTLVDFVYTLDPVGNSTQVVRTGSLPSTTTYHYDTMQRLTEVCYATSCVGAPAYIRWVYDAVGNCLSEIRPTGTTSYNYNAADQLTLGGSTSYTYDANGNQIVAGTQSFFTYDLANRLTAATQGSTTTTYEYDGDGVRLKASTGTQVTDFLWDVTGSMPQLID